MRPTAPIHEVAAMRFLEANSRFHRGEMSCEQAAELMGVSVSTFFRKRRRFAEEGEEGLVDRRIGKMSARRVPVDEVIRIISLFESKYYDFTVKHFHERHCFRKNTNNFTILKIHIAHFTPKIDPYNLWMKKAPLARNR